MSQTPSNKLGKGDAPLARPPSRKFSWDWLGLVPFFLFAIAFLLLPSASIFINSFVSPEGKFTFQNLVDVVTHKDLVSAYKASLSISAITAIGGALFGFLLAYAVVLGGLPK